VRPTVLVLRALGLGDAVSGVAPLRGVRRAWPSGCIVLAAPEATGGWLRRLGLVDEVLPTTGLSRLQWSGRDGPAVAVNLHGRGPHSHQNLQATRPGRLVGFRCPGAGFDDGPAWRPDEHEVERWCRLVRGAGGPCGPEDLRLPPRRGVRGRYVVVHPGAAAASRRWPAARWASVVDALIRRGVDVVVTGTTGERGLCARVAAGGARDVSGTLRLDDLADLVAGAMLVLCADTGVGHLATAYATPSVLLFGPTPPAWWGPAIDPDLHVVLWHGDSWSPSAGDPHASTLDPVLEQIEVDEVLDAADRMLEDGVLRRPA
jgi:ADP-heptose:LPS heptosyltransferase